MCLNRETTKMKMSEINLGNYSDIELFDLLEKLVDELRIRLLWEEESK